MSLQDLLRSHVFPPRGEYRSPTADLAGTSTTTTAVDPTLVANCIRAGDRNCPSPIITFEYSDSLLDSLAHVLDQTLIPEAPVPPKFIGYLSFLDTLIQYDSAIDEPAHYTLLQQTYGNLTRMLLETGNIYPGGERPPFKSWELAKIPEGRRSGSGHGKTDLEARGLDEYGVQTRELILWEYKRSIVLLLAYLLSLVKAAMSPGGLRLGLSPDGLPALVNSGLSDHAYKWCCQVRLCPHS